MYGAITTMYVRLHMYTYASTVSDCSADVKFTMRYSRVGEERRYVLQAEN